MRKRFFSILLCLCMVLMLFPVTAFAEEPAGTITINAPDEVCAQQDCEFTVTASEGVTLEAEFGYDFGTMGSGVDLTIDADGVGHGVMSAEWYAPAKDSFELLAYGRTEAGEFISASKTVRIRASHLFVDGVCECCGLRQYTITYDAGAYGTGSIAAGTKIQGEDFTLSSETFTREGYVQTGWMGSDGVFYELGGVYTTDADVTMTPKWSGDVSTEAELKEALDAGLTFVRLIGDFKLSSELNLSDKVITLDLNGHTLKGKIILADSSAAPHSILTLIDSDPAGRGVLDGEIELTRGDYGNASYLYANGGTITGKVSLNSYIAKMFCTSDTPTAIKGYAGNYGEIHGGILYGYFNADCIKEKTVTFMKDGSRYAVEVVADGSKVAAPIAPAVPEGMKFTGWYTDEALTEKYEFGSTLPENIKLYGETVPMTYIVEYDGGAEFGLCVDIKTHGEDLTLRGETFKRDGYVQTGWMGSDGVFYELGGVYTTDADVTMYAAWDKIITLTVPFTTTVKLGGNTAPGETTFELAIVDVNAGEERYADVTVSGSITTTNGVGDYEGALTFTGPSEQLWAMLSEGAFVQQVNGGEENWTYDDTVYGLVMSQVAYSTDDAVSGYTVLILPAICEETDDGVRYDIDWEEIDWENGPLDEMRFTNTYTKSTTKPGTPETGDNSNLTLWVALLVVSAAGVIGTCVYSKRRRSSQAK